VVIDVSEEPATSIFSSALNIKGMCSTETLIIINETTDSVTAQKTYLLDLKTSNAIKQLKGKSLRVPHVGVRINSAVFWTVLCGMSRANSHTGQPQNMLFIHSPEIPNTT
jgi:hypothetical protein